MSNKLFLKNVRLALSQVIGCVSRDVACCAIEGMGQEDVGRDYGLMVRYLNLMEPKEGSKKMTKKNVELSESEQDFIAGLTGNKGQGKLLLDNNNDLVDDEEETMDDYEYGERLGLSVVEKLKNSKHRNREDMLRFGFTDMGGKSVLNDQLTLSTANRAWLKKAFGTMGAYAEAMLGKKDSKAFLNTMEKRSKDPNERQVSVDDLLGVPKTKLDESETKRPGKAWLQDHHMLRSSLNGMDVEEHKLRWDAVDQAQGYTLRDGRMEDEIEEQRMARNGWIYGEDGKSKYIGFPIPYLRERNDKDENQVVEIMSDKGIMKVLNINFCMGSKPCLKFYNLVKLAYGVDSERTIKQEVIRRKLVALYRKAMGERDESIQTMRNGSYSVYYKAYKVEGKEICVFSPIPMRDLTDARKKEVMDKIQGYRQRKELWSSTDLIQDI